MKRKELVFWFVVVILVLYVSWRVIQPFVSALFFGMVLAYVFYPLHRRMKARVGNGPSAAVLTVTMVLLGLAFMGFTLLSSLNIVKSFYHDLGGILNWLTTLNLPHSIQSFFLNFRQQLMPRVSGYASSITFSVPMYILQLIIFISTFYYSLLYSDSMGRSILRMVPREQKGIVEEILSGADKTMNALVRAWLLLNVAKGFLMTLGYIIFGVSNIYTAIVAGLLTFLFSFVPLLEGWMLWVAAAIYLFESGSLLAALGISIYGAVLVSPLPDYTIRPMLVAKDADLDETLVFVGMTGGTLALGLKGLLLGPVVLSLGLVLLREWKNMQKRRASAGRALEQ
ncbi:AI-2E family transporter [Thermococcus sp. Bubb.Bath]|nr:AI-2E family transporter [Thermococcus sp. Bubb.Bath]